MTLQEIKNLKLKGWDWQFTFKKNQPVRVCSWHASGKNIVFQLTGNMIYITSWKAVNAVKDYFCREFGFDETTLKSNDNVNVPELGNIKVGFNEYYFEIRYKYEQLPEDFEKFYNGLEKNHILDKFVELTPKRGAKNSNFTDENVFTQAAPRQIIYFGAPGTSKSYTLNKDAEKIANQERVTFYPGYSYQQFVGTYKPYMDGDKIAYKFVPGPLLRLLEKALKAEKPKKAKPQDENKAETSAAETSTENQENGKEEKNTEKFLLIVEELNRAEAAAVFGDLFQLLDRNSDGSSEYPISVSEDLKQYLRRGDKNDIGVWHDQDEDEKLSFPSNFYIWATMNSADQGVFPLDTAFKRRWDFKYFGIDDAANELENNVQKFWNELRKTINKELHDKLKLNEDKLLGPFFMKVEENIDEQTFWQRFCSKVLLYLYEDAARLKRSQIFKDKTYSEIYNAFKKINSMDTLQQKWNEFFFFECKPAGNYPWAKAETEEDTSSASQADDNESAGEPITKNSGKTTDEQ